jgi:hypothetical protein
VVVEGASCRLDQSCAYLGVAFGLSAFHERKCLRTTPQICFHPKVYLTYIYTSYLSSVLLIPYTFLENHRSHVNLSSHHQTTLRVPKDRPQYIHMDAILLSLAKRRENTPHCDFLLERRCGQTHRQIHRCIPENVSLVTHTPRSLFHSRHVPQDQGICTAAEASYGLGARAR